MPHRVTARSRLDQSGMFKMLSLALLRIAVGWHFLYEGLTKLFDPSWTAAGYLQSTTGGLAGFYHWMVSDPTILSIVDALNVWGLILIGACLMFGLFTRLSAVLGIVMLGLYYVAHPPLPGAVPSGVAEGHYLLVNKNLIELLALGVIVVLPTDFFGFNGFLSRMREQDASPSAHSGSTSLAKGEPIAGLPADGLSRRQLLASLTGVPFVGAFAMAAIRRHGLESHEERHLGTQLASTSGGKTDAISGPTMTFDFPTLDDLQGKVPSGKIGDLQLSRMILGGNLMGGWAHARDLIYVSKLVKAYHHQHKVFETLRLAENCGINTILTNPLLCDVINDYWNSGGGQIQFISDCGGTDVLQMVQTSIDHGACACYIQGGVADKLVEEGQFDLIAQCLDLIRKNGLPAGIGGHRLATIMACVEEGFEVDFWMKTLHRTNYWSAQPEERHDNIWCEEPEDTVAFMRELKQPWIAFKTLAAGAIQPKAGFKYAFENGADFICVGMYDFQIVEDVNIVLNVLDGKLDRQRPWHA